ncbi:MAG: excinuclease ABC subunit C [Alteromonadaceae bacterium]|nr:MAG: excinuclease ABC subunit C [Alteromonadaceae bacterium]
MTQQEQPPVFDHKTFLKTLTQKAGVYQMYDDTGQILYVGKAKNLKNRLSSYFQKTGLPIKTQVLVKRIVNVEITVAPSEAEALVLEHNLIKAQKPPFNVMLRDDKSFPYIFISDGQRHPRVGMHRGAKKKKGRYFGPYPNAGAAKESLSFLQKTFGVRQCEDSVYQNRARPCLLHQIGRCSAPCVDVVSDEQYQADTEHTALFLSGKSEQLHEQLSGAMESASQALEFEQAAKFRDKITALRRVQAQQMVDVGDSDLDAIACVIEAAVVCVHIIYVRQGRIIGSKSYLPKDRLEHREAEVLSAFIAHTYLGAAKMDIPPTLIVSHDLEDEQALAQAITLQTGKACKVTSSVRTYRAKWLAMALEAARQNLKNHLNTKQSIFQRFEKLQSSLALDEMPQRMECFDISHSSGEKTVASCVVFNREGAVKSDYRRFNIDGIQGGDDYAAMAQALNRRYSRLQKEQLNMPDVLLLDGGKGQLSAARQVMEELGITDIFLAGVAKGTTRKPGFETLVLEDGTERVLESDNPALHLIQQIRDEAHRFAITGHKQRRDNARKRSTLEDIPGIGPKRRREILKYFGGLQEVKLANVDDLAKVPTISKKMAQEVYSVLHSE